MDDNKVAVLIENLMSQFRTFGEGLQQLNDKMDRHILENSQEFQKITERMDRMTMENRQDHQQLNQMIHELVTDQAEIKTKVNDLDQEFEIKLRRIK
jgi:hypothetical protein